MTSTGSLLYGQKAAQFYEKSNFKRPTLSVVRC